MMTLLKSLFRGTPTIATPAPDFRDAPPVALPRVDPPEVMVSETRTAIRHTTEPVFALIEYADAEGEITRRRITVTSFDQIEGVTYLRARCHERRADRTFRLDRVRQVFAPDGTTESVQDFFAALRDSTVSTSERAPKPRPLPDPNTPDVTPYTALRRAITPGLVLLAASARSDETLHPREIDVILRWCEDEAFDLRDAGHLKALPDAEGFDRIERTLRRLRPLQPDVVEAITAASRWQPPRLLRLARALADCAKADGKVDAIEAQLFDDLAQAGASRLGHGWVD